MKRIAEILRDSKTPLIIVRKNGETASGETKLHAFTDGEDGYAIVSNSSELHSPTSGKKLAPVAGVEQTVNAADVSELSEMSVGEKAGYTLLMDPDLAFDLAGETIKSPVDGTEVVVNYPANETAEDESEEDTESTEDESTEDESTEDETTEDESTDTETTEDDTTSEDDGAEEDADEEEIESIDDSESTDEDTESTEDESTESEEEDTEAGEDSESEEEEGLEEDATLVLEASLENKDDALRLVQVDRNGSEVAVFAGDAYLGTMRRAKAATNVQSLFDNGQKLYSAFKPVVVQAANLRASEVAAFGFEPAVVRVPVRKLVADAVENAKAEVASSVAADRKNLSTRYKKVLGLALLGMNKGFFEGANALVNETAKALQVAGVANAEATVRKALSKAADAYTVAVVEKAEELLNKSDDYLTGVSESVVKAEFKGDVSPEKLTTVYHDAKPAATSEGETAGFVSTFKPNKQNGNRFASLVSGLGRR